MQAQVVREGIVPDDRAAIAEGIQRFLRVVPGNARYYGVSLDADHVPIALVEDAPSRDGADFLALSFVRRAEDLELLRALVPKTMKLVAKIEKAAG